MFYELTEKLQGLFSKFGKGKLTERNIENAIREVRIALLDADVNYSVAHKFIGQVKEKAIGASLIKSISPRQQFVKLIHDELIELMGSEESSLVLKKHPSSILLCGLQGSGKTTQCVKLGYFLKNKGKKVLLAACDLQRPAAIEQLKVLAESVGISLFYRKDQKNTLRVAKEALTLAREESFDVLIVDTAGRLHLDDGLMQELRDLKNLLNPAEVLLVVSAAIGQDAVKVALEFEKKIEITGSILTMLDGDCKAGAAISIREVTKKPLKFEGIGEKVFDFQVFNPVSMADRILGMGDILNIVKRAKESIDEKEQKKLERKIKKATFNYNDYLSQMALFKKMGSMQSLMRMLPKNMMGDLNVQEGRLKKIEAMIRSMTPDEREEKKELDYSRRKRIALGSGLKLEEVAQIIKGFKKIKQVMKKFKQKGGFPSLEKIAGGDLWH